MSYFIVYFILFNILLNILFYSILYCVPYFILYSFLKFETCFQGETEILKRQHLTAEEQLCELKQTEEELSNVYLHLLRLFC